MKTVAIVGGGIAGLAVAETLRHRREDVRVVVLEAASAPGGKITTRNVDGFVVETGPHGFLDKEPDAMAMVSRLGLDDRLLPADEASAARFIFRDGKLRKLPSSPPAFLTSDVMPLGARLRAVMEPWADAPPEDEESIWAFAARKLGPMAADVMVDAFVTGIYGGDPKQLSVRAAFPRLHEIESQYGSLIKGQIAIAKAKKARGETASGGATGPGGTLHSFKDGLGELIAALAAKAEVRTGFEAKRLVALGEGRYRVEGTGEALEADAVLLTTPAFTAAELVEPFAAGPARKLREIPYVPVAVVVQGFEASKIGCAVNGFGFLVPDREQRRILGSIWASTVFAGHAPDGMVMTRTLLGGARRPEHADGDDDTLAARALEELRLTMGLAADARPVMQQIIRWPQAIPQYNLGHLERRAAAMEVEGFAPGLFLGGNAYRGVAMIQCMVDAGPVADRIGDHLDGLSAI